MQCNLVKKKIKKSRSSCGNDEEDIIYSKYGPHLSTERRRTE